MLPHGSSSCRVVCGWMLVTTGDRADRLAPVVRLLALSPARIYVQYVAIKADSSSAMYRGTSLVSAARPGPAVRSSLVDAACLSMT